MRLSLVKKSMPNSFAPLRLLQYRFPEIKDLTHIVPRDLKGLLKSLVSYCQRHSC